MEKKFKKYHYLGVVIPEVPEFWKLTVLHMLEKIDKEVRPKLMPRFVLNQMYDKAYGEDNEIINWFWYNKLNSLIKNVHIIQIKQKFATLRVYGLLIPEIQDLINKAMAQCDLICEFCGGTETSHVMVKSWVRNLCVKCKENSRK